MARRSPRKSGKRSKRRSPRKSGKRSKRRSPRKSRGKKSKRRSPRKSRGKKSKRRSPRKSRSKRRSPRKSRGKKSKRRSPRKSRSKRRSPKKSGKRSKRRSPRKSGKKSKRSSRPTYEKAQKEEQKRQEKEARKQARREAREERRQREQRAEEFGMPFYEEKAQQQSETERDRIDAEIAFKRGKMSSWDVINMINDVSGIDPLHITIESSPADVKRAYRRAAIKTHPDKANQLDEIEVYRFQETFKLLKEKYDDYLARFAPAGYLRRRKRYSRRR